MDRQISSECGLTLAKFPVYLNAIVTFQKLLSSALITRITLIALLQEKMEYHLQGIQFMMTF